MLLIELPVIDYDEAYNLQKDILENKLSKGSPDVLLLLEHPPTITLGIRGKISDLLVREECLTQKGIEIYFSDRGGEATFHGPGQLVCYPIINLKQLGISVKDYVNRLERTIITALDLFGVKAYRRNGKIGVWTGPDHKIASIGIRISRRIAYHGFSLNIALEHNPSDFMISCGMPDARMISLNDLSGTGISMGSAKEAIADSFAKVFGVNLEPCSLDEFFE